MTDWHWICARHVEDERNWRSALGERPLAGRETRNVRYLLPAAALGRRERRTAPTAPSTNLMKHLRRPRCAARSGMSVGYEGRISKQAT